MTDDEEAVSKLEQLEAEPKTIEILGTEFEIHPFENDEFIGYIKEAKRREDRGGDFDLLPFLVTKVLKKDDPKITREQVDKAPMAVMTKTVNAVEEVNGLEDFTQALNQKEQKMQP